MTFEEAKDQVAKKYDYKDWQDLYLESLVSAHFNIKPYIDEAAELYATAKAAQVTAERDDLKMTLESSEKLRVIQQTEIETLKSVIINDFGLQSNLQGYVSGLLAEIERLNSKAAQAWEECFKAVESQTSFLGILKPTNPYLPKQDL